jgi:beta-phosphoglucomutase
VAGNHRYDALLFDFDGVLADTEPVHYACWMEVLAPHGVRISWEDYQRDCVGVADAVLMARLGLGGDALNATLVAQKQARFRVALEESPPFLAETLELIPELARHHRLAVVSSSFRSEVEPPLIAARIRPCFLEVICADDVQNLKPAAEPYSTAARRLSVVRPLVIEDSDTGVASGEAAGFEVLRVSGARGMPEELRRTLGW